MDGADARFARGKVILTVMHLDHVPEHCDPSNLRAACQRCHLRYDRTEHAQHARERRHRARAVRELWDEAV